MIGTSRHLVRLRPDDRTVCAIGTIILGGLLVIYAVIGPSKVRFHVDRPHEKWVGGVVGVLTGLVSRPPPACR